MKGGDGMVHKDIFKDMQQKIGCPNISDLPCHRREVWVQLKAMCLSDYPTKQLEDFSRYVFDVDYSILTKVRNRKDVKTYGRIKSID